MFIYIFKSELFKGQQRRIVSSYPLNIDALYDFINSDNTYPSDGKWYLTEEL